MLYVLLLNRYHKYYEYSVNKSHLNSSLEVSLLDMQRWRRRARQSLHKLQATKNYLELHVSQTPPTPAHGLPKAPPLDEEQDRVRKSLLGDYDQLIAEIEDYNRGLEFLISISTTMVQLASGRQSVSEAVNVRHLTYIAMVFGPLELLAALFSMSGDFLPGSPHFWVYLVSASIMLILVLAVVTISDSKYINGCARPDAVSNGEDTAELSLKICPHW